MTAIDKRISPTDLAQKLCELQRIGRLAIFTDIDGTLSPIAATPNEAIVLPEARSALSSLVECGVTVVAVTGRSAKDARALMDLEQISYAGNHGFELLLDGRHIVRPDVQAAADLIRDSIDQIRDRIAATELHGLVFEDKRYTGSIHYRLAEDQEAAYAALAPIVTDVAHRHGLRVTEGRLVLEIRPSIRMNKGVFVREFLASHTHQCAVFLGDDTTDLDGFTAVQAARTEGFILSGLNVGVQAAESPGQLLEDADVLIDGVPNMATALAIFARRVQATPHA